jgi:hypothetical protein
VFGLVRSPNGIADYNGTIGAVRGIAANLDPSSRAIPTSLAEALVGFARAINPPVRLPLGSDPLVAIERKHASDALILKEWRSVAVSTDFTAEVVAAA